MGNFFLHIFYLKDSRKKDFYGNKTEVWTNYRPTHIFGNLQTKIGTMRLCSFDTDPFERKVINKTRESFGKIQTS